jgi:hypothetical protein
MLASQQPPVTFQPNYFDPLGGLAPAVCPANYTTTARRPRFGYLPNEDVEALLVMNRVML